MEAGDQVAAAPVVDDDIGKVHSESGLAGFRRFEAGSPAAIIRETTFIFKRVWNALPLHNG